MYLEVINRGDLRRKQASGILLHVFFKDLGTYFIYTS